MDYLGPTAVEDPAHPGYPMAAPAFGQLFNNGLNPQPGSVAITNDFFLTSRARTFSLDGISPYFSVSRFLRRLRYAVSL